MKRCDFAFLAIGLGVGLTLGVGLFLKMLFSRTITGGIGAFAGGVSEVEAALLLSSPVILVLLGTGLLLADRRPR